MCGHAKRHGWTDLEAAAQEARAHAHSSVRAGAPVSAGAWSGRAGAAGPPPYPSPPPPDPDLLIADADRERVVDALKQATADGRLTIDEFSDRVEETYRARTFGDLRTVLRQLPASVRAAAEPPRPAPVRAPVERHRSSGLHPVLVTALVVLTVIMLTAGRVLVFWPLFVLFFVFRGRRHRWYSSRS